MRPLKRFGQNKRGSAKKFNRNTNSTKSLNMKAGPMRGGIRL